MDIIKMGILGIVGVLLGIQFKAYKQEYSIYIGFAVCIVMFSYGIGCMGKVMELVQEWKQLLGDSAAYIGILLKVTGITYLCEFCAGICKDAGFSAIAGQLEIAGKLSVLLIGMPIVMSLLDMLQGFF